MDSTHHVSPRLKVAEIRRRRQTMRAHRNALVSATDYGTGWLVTGPALAPLLEDLVVKMVTRSAARIVPQTKAVQETVGRPRLDTWILP